MKPPIQIDMHRVGNLGGNQHAMSIDEDSLAHVMSLLTDVYSDDEMACLREYSTNARDSHLESGQTRPIEISLPNLMTPYLKIRDYGIGMNESDVAEVYSKYGASTKRDSDVYNGVLGIGGKAALTYSSQFTVTAIKNGVKTVVMVSRVEDGTGVMEVVATAATSEGNGVEISIPTKPGNSFASKAEYLFSFWPEGSVLVNGKAPARIALQAITPTIGMSNDVSSDVIVMGGVPYPLSDGYNLSTANIRDAYIVAFVEMGEVNFPPSREALSYTAKTKATINDITDVVDANLRRVAQDDVDSQTSKPEAFKCYRKWLSKVGGTIASGLTYDGVTIPASILFPEHTVWDRYGYRGARTHKVIHGTADITTLNASLVILNYTGIQINSTYRSKIDQWARSRIGQVFTDHRFIEKGKTVDLSWVDPARIVDFATIKAETLNSNSTGYRKPPTIDIYDLGGRVVTLPIDTTKTLLYVSPADKISGSKIVALYKQFTDIQVVALGKNRWDKFLRENPTAKPLQTFVREKFSASQDALTDLDKKILGCTDNSYTARRVSWMDETRVDDPDLVDDILLAKGGQKSAAVDDY